MFVTPCTKLSVTKPSSHRKWYSDFKEIMKLRAGWVQFNDLMILDSLGNDILGLAAGLVTHTNSRSRLLSPK